MQNLQHQMQQQLQLQQHKHLFSLIQKQQPQQNTTHTSTVTTTPQTPIELNELTSTLKQQLQHDPSLSYPEHNFQILDPKLPTPIQQSQLYQILEPMTISPLKHTVHSTNKNNGNETIDIDDNDQIDVNDSNQININITGKDNDISDEGYVSNEIDIDDTMIHNDINEFSTNAIHRYLLKQLDPHHLIDSHQQLDLKISQHQQIITKKATSLVAIKKIEINNPLSEFEEIKNLILKWTMPLDDIKINNNDSISYDSEDFDSEDFDSEDFGNEYLTPEELHIMNLFNNSNKTHKPKKSAQKQKRRKVEEQLAFKV